MSSGQSERQAADGPSDDATSTPLVTKRAYQKPVLNQVGLLRDLTQFYF